MGRLSWRNVWGAVLRVGGWGWGGGLWYTIQNVTTLGPVVFIALEIACCILYVVPFRNIFFFLIHCTNILFFKCKQLIYI